MPIILTDKQNEYIRKANRRWNFKVGATGSGKTYMDTAFTIPYRIRERAGKKGLNVIIGNTKGTLQRNIIQPLQEHYTEELVSNIGADNTCTMFGEKVYCLGADKVNQVTKIQGSTIKYGYGDEMTTWNEEVFQMLKSRLRTPYSIFDGTMNPANPKHFMKTFIDSGADIYYQHYTIDDNPTLPADFVRELKKEYEGTVYYQWYILGLWSRAEGIVFPKFANNPDDFIIDANEVPKRFRWVSAAYDLGGNKSNYALVCSARGYDDTIYVLRTQKIQPQDLRLEDVEKACKKFIQGVERDYGVPIQECYIDDSYNSTINTLNDWRYIFDNAARIKASMPLHDRPLTLSKLMSQGRFKLIKNECTALIDELQNAIFDEKSDKTIILDDGSQTIDQIDALFYSMASDYAYLFD